ncbi:MAG: VanZ family protein [Fimbriimonadaceae bacterium]
MSTRWRWAIGLGCAAVVIYLTSTTLITQRQLARFVASVMPGVTEDGFFEWWQTWWWVFVKGFHVTEFFVLTLVAGFALRRFGVKRWLLYGALTAVVYAISDEWHQTFVTGRGGRATDVLIDCIGVSLAVLVLRWRLKESATS